MSPEDLTVDLAQRVEREALGDHQLSLQLCVYVRSVRARACACVHADVRVILVGSKILGAHPSRVGHGDESVELAARLHVRVAV